MNSSHLNFFLFLLFLLPLSSLSQDCTLSAIVSIYQCQYRCQVLYGTTQPLQRLFYNFTSQLCQPKTICPINWTYQSTNNTCSLQNYTTINGWILSPNIQNLTVVYVSCNGNGYFANGTCFCNVGWESSKVKKEMGVNVTTMQFCDVKGSTGSGGGTEGYKVFNEMGWGERRNAIGEVWQQEQWVNWMVFAFVPVYSLILVFAVHNWMRIRGKNKKNNTKPKSHPSL